MGLLYHWRKENYEDNYVDPSHADGFWLSQDSKRWQEAEHGEWVWAFSRRDDGRYVLVASYQVDCVEENGASWCRYTATSIAGTVVLYDPREGEDIEPIIRQLPISLKNPSLGRNFQGRAAVKKIEPVDEVGLLEFAKRQKPL